MGSAKRSKKRALSPDGGDGSLNGDLDWKTDQNGSDSRKRSRTHQLQSTEITNGAEASKASLKEAEAALDDDHSESSDDFVQEYAGFHPSTRLWTPDRVNPDAITPEAFFDKYICTRTPCILTHIPTEDPHWSRIRRWVTPPDFPTTSRTSRFGYIKLAAGDEIVQVETRCKPSSDGKVNAEFGGGGKRLRMPFGEFLERLEREGSDDDVAMDERIEMVMSGLGVDMEDSETDSDFEAGNVSTRTDMDTLLDHTRTITEYLQPPLSQLSTDFPKHPKLFGHLIPQQVNLWMGCGPPEGEGTSSGLHHDFADNLYVLLRGRKRFTLFSPRDAARMEMHGKIAKVHPNGLIAYENEVAEDNEGMVDESEDEDGEDVEYEARARSAKIPRADGAFPHDVAKWKLKELEKRKKELEMLSDLVSEGTKVRMDEAADLAEMKGKKAQKKANEAKNALEAMLKEGQALKLAVKKLEMEIESALEEELDLRLIIGADESDSEENEDEDDLQEDESDEEPGDENDGSGDDGDEDENGEIEAMDVDNEAEDTDDLEGDNIPGFSRVYKGKEPYTQESNQRKQNGENGQLNYSGTNSSEEKAYPRSFSRVDVATLRKYVESGEVVEGRLQGTTPAVVDLKEGEMLYLPTGWFHEVTSFGISNMRENDPSERIHVAFNYWMHPPTESSFNAPYADAYWARNWENIEKAMAAQVTFADDDEDPATAEPSDTEIDSDDEDFVDALTRRMKPRPWRKRSDMTDEEKVNVHKKWLASFGFSMGSVNGDDRVWWERLGAVERCALVLGVDEASAEERMRASLSWKLEEEDEQGNDDLEDVDEELIEGSFMDGDEDGVDVEEAFGMGMEMDVFDDESDEGQMVDTDDGGDDGEEEGDLEGKILKQVKQKVLESTSENSEEEDDEDSNSEEGGADFGEFMNQLGVKGFMDKLMKNIQGQLISNGGLVQSSKDMEDDERQRILNEYFASYGSGDEEEEEEDDFDDDGDDDDGENDTDEDENDGDEVEDVDDVPDSDGSDESGDDESDDDDDDDDDEVDEGDDRNSDGLTPAEEAEMLMSAVDDLDDDDLVEFGRMMARRAREQLKKRRKRTVDDCDSDLDDDDENGEDGAEIVSEFRDFAATRAGKKRLQEGEEPDNNEEPDEEAEGEADIELEDESGDRSDDGEQVDLDESDRRMRRAVRILHAISRKRKHLQVWREWMAADGRGKWTVTTKRVKT